MLLKKGEVLPLCTAAVAEELRRRGLEFNLRRQARVARRTIIIGNRLYRRFAAAIGDELAPARAARFLGAGFVLTEFAAAPVRLSSELAAPVLALGALANLIVTGFDTLVDGGAAPDLVLARSALEGSSQSRHVIARLVSRYYEDLGSLQPTDPEIRAALEHVIRRMYDAEVQAAREGEKLRGVEWRRKSALPFVVMGFAAWVVAPSEGSSRRAAHLRWLYRLGEFFGLIDDCADLEPDRSAHRANRMAFLIAERGCDRAVARVAALGVRVLSGWEQLVDGQSGTSLSRQTFLTTVWSWLQTALHSPQAPQA